MLERWAAETFVLLEDNNAWTYGSAGSGFFSHFVDNDQYSYVVAIDFDQAMTSSLRACAARIRYNYSLENISLPAIYNQTSP